MQITAMAVIFSHCAFRIRLWSDPATMLRLIPAIVARGRPHSPFLTVARAGLYEIFMPRVELRR